MQQVERVPPLPARLGLACYKCFKEEDVQVSRCTGCLRVGYCSRECQNADWKTHKAFCKATKALENDRGAAMTLLFPLADAPSTNLDYLHNASEAHAANVQGFVQRSMGRELSVPERNLVGWEPRCMACTRTDQLIRIEFTARTRASGGASSSSTTAKPRQLTPCVECNASFCCSVEHWTAARALHHAPLPTEDGHSQCELNKLARGDAMLEAALAGSHDGVFRWAPERIKERWESVVRKEGRGKEKGSGRTRWEDEIADEMRKAVGVPSERPMGPWVRMASDALCMPMTILWGLETLNIDDEWTRKHTLTIHILGATMIEVTAAMVFEEILHRLPEVKTLKLLLCGPEMQSGRAPKVYPLDTCPECARRERKRVHEHTADTYHGYVAAQGSKYEKPDLAIAFNAGASSEPSSRVMWAPTMKLLVEKKIKTVFTSYNSEEAHGDAAALRAAGAKLAVEAERNAWGSAKLIPEPAKVYGFYSASGWVSGAF
ncbi:hypothetical protein MIND_00819400 [Mycena indigotica]|uniref:MYND-type domain-containing protein n=1 Tax=Mycena indigotica TaxID=2126181 RepID=A0A8H6W490_9AGAR|nr:uncharacterized protein MIND_00819400 [Mycena indigotica]KAF7298719.1 hypothetical protein MIND_00819400 [Mycena indigotica]